MQERDHAKTASLVVGCIVMAMAFCRLCGMSGMSLGIYPSCPLYARLLHPLAHAGIIHATLNVYVWLQIVFFCGVRSRQLLTAWVIACSCPAAVATWGGTVGTHVVGLSGVVYTLLGELSLRAKAPVSFHLWVAAYLAMGWLVGGVAVGFHLYCYVAGRLSALIFRD